VGDFLISVGGTPIVDQTDVMLAINRRRVGEVVTVVVNRGGVTRRLAVRLGARR
jgi:S1-C subfamily serine protease